MKAQLSILILIAFGCLFFACGDGESILNPTTIDKTKLVPPLGLRAEALSQKVTLFWYTSNYEEKFEGYYVYMASGDYSSQSSDTTLSSAFSKVDSVGLTGPSDEEISRTISGLTNGQTYSFAVAAFADDGKKISYPSNIVAVAPEEKVVTTKEKLSPPLGLHSVTGNEQISLFWHTSNYESIFQGYYIFMAQGDYTGQSSDSSLNAAFQLVDSVQVTGSSDDLVNKTIANLTNGTTYSFAVVAYAYFGEQISYPSNVIKDTPRPEILSITITSASTSQVGGDDTQAGFDFNTLAVKDVPAVGYQNENGADIINEAFDPSKGSNIRSWLAGMNGGGLQDLGYMSDLSAADMAPEQGYSDEGKSIAVLAGHVYAVKTGDGYYGKLIVTGIQSEGAYAITFNAAFQSQQGNRNYKINPNYWEALGIHNGD